MGIIKRKKKQPFEGEIKVIDPEPVWVGTDKATSVKRFMRTDEAEQWVKDKPSRSVKLYAKQYELQSY